MSRTWFIRGTFLLKTSWVKKEKRRKIGQREDGGQRAHTSWQYHIKQNE